MQKCINSNDVVSTVQCASGDDNDNEADDDMEAFNDCDEQVPVVRPIPQSYMIRPPADTRAFLSDNSTSRAQPPAYADGKLHVSPIAGL